MDINDFAGKTDPEIPADRESFRIKDDAEAIWAMRKAKHFRDQIAANCNLAALERTRIDEWEERVNTRLGAEFDYFQAILIRYGREQRDSEGRKSIDTPFGVVKSRQGQPKWEVDDEEFIAWARENSPDLVRVKEEPALAEMKKRFEVADTATLGVVAVAADGQIVPGIRVTPVGISYSVEVAK